MLARHQRRRWARAGLLAVLIGATAGAAWAAPPISAVAVFPVENLSGEGVPAESVRQVLVEALTGSGIRVLPDEDLEGFMRRHRVRYAGGLDAATAETLRTETRVDGVVFATIDLSKTSVPPKVALIVRLVSIHGAPEVVWATDVGLAGDDAPGLFELGLVGDYDVLLGRALRETSAALLTHLQAGRAGDGPRPAGKFRPKDFYRGYRLEPGRTYTVAVLPFHNASPRRNAGDVMALLFVRHLAGRGQFRVLDTGVVRRELLAARVIMEGGPSLRDADTVAALVDADFVLGGRVLSYDDHDGENSNPRVEFSTVLIEKASRRVVWTSNSYNDGIDGIRLFDRGRTRTAHRMATQMVRLTAEQMAGGRQ